MRLFYFQLMTLTKQPPDMPVMKKSTIETVEQPVPPVTFNTAHYEKRHGKAPHHNSKGVFSFLPPKHLGKRPLQFHNMTYGEAKAQAEAWIGERPAYGEFILIP